MSAGAALTRSGFNNILDMAFNSASDTRSFQYFVIGTGTTTPTITDTSLENTITSWTAGGTTFKAYSTVTFTGADQRVTTRAFISAAEATGFSISEYADVNNKTTKELAGRFVFEDAVTKTAAVTLTVITKYKRA